MNLFYFFPLVFNLPVRYWTMTDDELAAGIAEMLGIKPRTRHLRGRLSINQARY